MDIVKGRRSVRTYDGTPLSAEDRAKLEAFWTAQTNPWGIPVEFRFLDPAAHGLKSPVLGGETLYVAAKVKRVPHFEEAYGYAFEALVLYAWSLGIGTVWIGGTMNRENFERAMELAPDEVMPCVTPVGYPAKRMAVKETLMRKGVKADKRLELSEIIFEGEVGQPLTPETAAALGDVPEMVRWAPSAVNKQPWRMLVKDGRVHFYEKPDAGYVNDATGDLQRIDLGIALYHFEYGMKKAGREVTFCAEDPGLPVPAGWQYAASFAF